LIKEKLVFLFLCEIKRIIDIKFLMEMLTKERGKEEGGVKLRLRSSIKERLNWRRIAKKLNFRLGSESKFKIYSPTMISIANFKATRMGSLD